MKGLSAVAAALLHCCRVVCVYRNPAHPLGQVSGCALSSVVLLVKEKSKYTEKYVYMYYTHDGKKNDHFKARQQ